VAGGAQGAAQTTGDNTTGDKKERTVKVEIWSDVVCPWCYVGKRQFEDALSRFGHADQVSVEWRSFELDPSSPARVDMPMSTILQRKYGMTPEQAEAANRRMTTLAASVGLEYHLDEVQVGNTFDAHRLIHLAATHGLGDAMKERLFAAYFTEGQSPSEHDTLARLGTEVGLDPAEVRATLDGEDFAAEVRDDEARAASLGVSGVPFFVIDEAFGVSGAQPPDVLLGALERAWSESHPLVRLDAPPDQGPVGDACADGACAL
jgi:predicted DsbA family dithiol-disulfide isomerase